MVKPARGGRLSAACMAQTVARHPVRSPPASGLKWLVVCGQVLIFIYRHIKIYRIFPIRLGAQGLRRPSAGASHIFPEHHQTDVFQDPQMLAGRGLRRPEPGPDPANAHPLFLPHFQDLEPSGARCGPHRFQKRFYGPYISLKKNI
jgi:hypothetical protein